MHALNIVAYLLNMVPDEANPKTPYELQIGRKSNLRRFHLLELSTKYKSV